MFQITFTVPQTEVTPIDSVESGVNTLVINSKLRRPELSNTYHSNDELSIHFLDETNKTPTSSFEEGLNKLRTPIMSLRLVAKKNLIKINNKPTLMLIISSLFITLLGNTAGLLINIFIKGKEGIFNPILSFFINGICTSTLIVAAYMINNKIIFKKNLKLFDSETERLTLEKEQYLLKEQLQINEEILKHKMAIYAHISSGIRYPLQRLLFETETLNSLNIKPKEVIESVEQSCKQIEKVVDSILQIHKTLADSNMSEKFTLKQLADTLFTPLKMRAEVNKIALICRSDIDFSSAFEGDFKSLIEILANFLNNAVKFSRPSFIQSSFVKLIIRKEQEIPPNIVQLHFTVYDNGIGVGQEQLMRIFQPFYNTRFNIEDSTEGVGIGLHIASILINKINKHSNVKNPVGVTSEIGKGSSFWFRVQLINVPNVKNICKSDHLATMMQGLHIGDARVDKQVEIHKKLNILIVDDVIANQKIMETMLTKLGHTVSVLNDGKEVIDIMENTLSFLPYDIIFMDLDMPILGGLETASILINKFNVKIPIIAYTSNGTDEDIARCLSAGMQDIITKPVKSHKLKVILKKFFAGDYYKDNSAETTSSSLNQLYRQDLPTLSQSPSDYNLALLSRNNFVGSSNPLCFQFQGCSSSSTNPVIDHTQSCSSSMDFHGSKIMPVP